jgi:hypothetical protein
MRWFNSLEPSIALERDPGGMKMPLSETVKKAWIEIQKKHHVPVNAIGLKVDVKDVKTLRVWKEEGIDKFLKR